MNVQQFQSELEKQQIQLTSRQLEQFELYFKLLVEWNEKINLTAITDKEGVYLKHFYDSLSAGFYYNFFDGTPLHLCDVGAGAGFPSIPLKIAFPHLKVTIVDSLKKRIGFLEELAQSLELENVNFFHDRAETFGQNSNHRAQYDIVMARAVARLSVLSEFCMPLNKVDGHFIAMKGSSSKEELKDAEKAIKTLGGEVKDIHQFVLPFENSERSIIIIEKVKSTPKKYPRKPGVPAKSPIE